MGKGRDRKIINNHMHTDIVGTTLAHKPRTKSKLHTYTHTHILP